MTLHDILSLLVILLAVVALSVAHDLVTARRIKR